MDKEDWQRKGAGHRQRLRDKFLSLGVTSFTDVEMVEMLLTMGTPRRDCKDLARAAMAHFGSFAAVLEASSQDLQEIKGLGPNNVFAIHFVHGVARRFLAERVKKKDYVRSSRDVIAHLQHAMAGSKREQFAVVFLDAEHGIIDTKTVAEGTLTSSAVYPREVVKEALSRHAAALVIAHNHPSGNPLPSAEDRKLTRNLFLACSLMDIRLLDHLIIAGTAEPYSFADQGIMAQIKSEVASSLP